MKCRDCDELFCQGRSDDGGCEPTTAIGARVPESDDSEMKPITTNVKLFTSPDKKKILYAVFSSRLVGANEGDPQRAKHYVYKDPDSECYIHYAHYLVPDDVPPRDEPGLFVSERVFFGRYRAVEQIDRYLPETWATIGDIVNKMETYNKHIKNHER